MQTHEPSGFRLPHSLSPRRKIESGGSGVSDEAEAGVHVTRQLQPAVRDLYVVRSGHRRRRSIVGRGLSSILGTMWMARSERAVRIVIAWFVCRLSCFAARLFCVAAISAIGLCNVESM